MPLPFLQVDNPGDTEYNGRGFRSTAAITGSFSQTFTLPGTYYYIGEGYANIGEHPSLSHPVRVYFLGPPGFTGTIVVQELVSQSYPILVTVNGASVDLSSALCGDTPSPYANYTFSAAHTPRATVTPAQGSVGMMVQVSAQSLSSVREDNTLTFGGIACGDLSSPVSAVKSVPAFASVDEAARTYSSVVFNCTFPGIDPGEYEISLHVEGRGWAYTNVNDSVVSVSAQITGPPNPPAGSLRGGLELSIPVHGLSNRVVGNMTVTLGNTPCLVQRVDTSGSLDGTLTCITGSARDDGYSSLVAHDGALAYWSLQSSVYAPDGTFLRRDGASYFASGGLLGAQANASVVGVVSLQEAGISGNNITDQAAGFNSSYIRVPSLDQLTSDLGFGLELWFSSGTVGGAYRILVDASVPSSPAGTSGYMLVLNPCNQLEFWLGSRGAGDDCSVVQSAGPCPASCSGLTTVTSGLGTRALPSGQWSVIQSPLSDWSQWHQVSVGWSPSVCNLAGVCTGDQVLYIDGSLVNSTSVAYVASANPIAFGGTPLHPVRAQWDGVSQIAPFVGLLDEISFYATPLSSEVVARHYHFGSTGAQPIWLVTEDVDGVGGSGQGAATQGFAHFLTIDWENQSNEGYLVNGSTALLFQWTG